MYLDMELQIVKTFPTTRSQTPIRLIGLKKHDRAETRSPSTLPVKDPDIELELY